MKPSDIVQNEAWLKRITVDSTGCWLWRGLYANGYGYVQIKRKKWLVHRLLYTIVNGDVEKGKELHHECGVKACVNPLHLVCLTSSEHKARHEKTHCKKGHAFTPDNTRTKTIAWGRGWQRVCRECERKRSLAAYYRRRDLQLCAGEPSDPSPRSSERVLPDGTGIAADPSCSASPAQMSFGEAA